MIYEVFTTPAVRRRIREQAEYIAVEQEAPEIAAKWLTRVFDKIDELAEMPRRFALAAEDAWCDFELRQQSIGEFVLFFTVIDEERRVWVIHAKHGKQRTEPDAFPQAFEPMDEDDESRGASQGDLRREARGLRPSSPSRDRHCWIGWHGRLDIRPHLLASHPTSLDRHRPPPVSAPPPASTSATRVPPGSPPTRSSPAPRGD